MEKLSLEAMKNASEEAFRYAVVNAINQLYRDMNVGKVWDNTVGIDRTSEKVSNIDETQKISFEALANGGQIDEQVVLAHKESISEWAVGVLYKLGMYATYNDLLYKAIQEHTSIETWTPDVSPSLFTIVNEKHAGTIDDPIPITEDMAGQMIEYVKGLNYIESDGIYLMSREGMADGETISLPYFPSQLVGTYFTIVEAV